MFKNRMQYGYLLLVGTLGALASAAFAKPGVTEPTAPKAIRIRLCLVKSTPAQAKKHFQSEALHKAGGLIFAAPLLLTQESMAAEFKSEQRIPHLIYSSQPEKVGYTLATLRARAVPYLCAKDTVQIDLDVDNIEVIHADAESVKTAKYGFFHTGKLKIGQETAFGTWMQDGKLCTVFAEVTEVKPKAH